MATQNDYLQKYWGELQNPKETPAAAPQSHQRPHRNGISFNNLFPPKTIHSDILRLAQ